ncbi:hypothetical protein [Ancylobacter sp. TS-1]|uniref:hypothetical protein n=1 Tax=Ancylobacter sp. TS-1 TaxID=1850374 RepID=UPI001265B971|nr:hypothetical protein [Ancylobacter sp. TS-1]QFR34713.1 hypothetical protein GBB76_17280 [Ancylobacter sp. TS-1]
MPNTPVPANVIGLPAVSRYDRSDIMRAAVAHARQIIEGEREAYLRRWSGAIRCGDRRPAMVLPTWRAAMSEALRYAWKDAKKARAAMPASTGAPRELAAIELRILSIQAAERVTRDESAMLPALYARAAELSRAAMAHVHH